MRCVSSDAIGKSLYTCPTCRSSKCTNAVTVQQPKANKPTERMRRTGASGVVSHASACVAIPNGQLLCVLCFCLFACGAQRCVHIGHSAHLRRRVYRKEVHLIRGRVRPEQRRVRLLERFLNTTSQATRNTVAVRQRPRHRQPAGASFCGDCATFSAVESLTSEKTIVTVSNRNSEPPNVGICTYCRTVANHSRCLQ